MRKLSALSALLVALAACGSGERTTAIRPSPTPPATAAGPPAAPGTCSFPSAPEPDADDAGTDEDTGEHEDGNGRREEAAGDTCAIADENLRRVEGAIRAATPATPVASKPWDRRAPLERMPLVRRRLALLPAEERLLREHGFVVLAKHAFGSYGAAFHEIYQSQLPIYVSVDAILHAIYIANDALIADLEDDKLQPLLAGVLDALACALPAAPDYPAEARRDLDLYLAVARALLRGDAPHSVLRDATIEAEAAALVKRAHDASELAKVPLFGRERMIDFTAYTPRGHYTTEARRRYFRAAMWLSRLELNLVSRSSRSSQPGVTPDPSETPREAVTALALADLVERAGVAADVARMDGAWALLAGRREDVSVARLAELRRTAGIASLAAPDAPAKLRAAIGTSHQRTARLHYMPQGSTELPAIATLLGPRVVPDAAATRPLVHGETPGREMLTAADMAYVLGHDRALVHLAGERAQFPTLDVQLAAARRIAATAERGKDDLYSAWLDAIVGLASPIAGARPSFTATPAYADLRLNSALAAFGQLKHNYVLIAGESYFEGGCEIPDGYVEPAPAVYDALLAYAARGERAVAGLDPKDELGARAYFKRLGEVLGVLRAIQLDELAGRPLTADQKAFLSMVAETTPWTTGGPPTYTGWWFDLHRKRRDEGLSLPDFIASYFTGAKISYVGATAPRLGVFVIDTGGAPRVVVGPVARAYEHHGPQARRLDDAAGAALPEADRHDPWAKRYTAPAAAPPAFGIEYYGGVAKVTAGGAIGAITIEPLDHHRLPNGPKVTRRLRAGETSIPIRTRKAEAEISVLHLQIGDFHDWLELGVVEASASASYGGWKSPEPAADPDADPE
jgi:hypothetical protein